jgi:hypothetical protein
VRLDLMPFGFEFERTPFCASGALELPAEFCPCAGSATETSRPAGKDSAGLGSALGGHDQGDARSEHRTDYHSEAQQTD